MTDGALDVDYLVVAGGLGMTQDWLSETFALVIDVWPSTTGIWLYMAGAVLASAVLTMIPAMIAYFRSLGDTLLSS